MTWTPEAIQELRALYANGGTAAVCERWPDLTKRAIKHACVRFDAHTLNWRSKWPESEKQVIRDVYPSAGGPGVRKLLPHRSLKSIRDMAGDMRVFREGFVRLRKDSLAPRKHRRSRAKDPALVQPIVPKVTAVRRDAETAARWAALDFSNFRL